MQQKYFSTVWAVSGDLQTGGIPNLTDINGYVSYTQGFTLDYQRVLGTDALAKQVQRQTINSALNDITENLQDYQQYGCAEFITAKNNNGSAFAYNIGAMVRYSASGTAPFVTYVSLTNGNIDTPGLTQNWLQLSGPFATITDCNNALLGKALIPASEFVNSPFPGNFGILETISSQRTPGPNPVNQIVQFAYNCQLQDAPWFRQNVNNAGYTTWLQLSTVQHADAIAVAAQNNAETFATTAANNAQSAAITASEAFATATFATIAGNTAQTFSVANATLDTQAVARGQTTLVTDGSGNWKKTTVGAGGIVIIEMGGVISINPNVGETAVVFPFGGFPNQVVDVTGNLLAGDLIIGIAIGFQLASRAEFFVGAVGSSAGPYGALWRATGS